jgi:hypothetical protein
MIMCAFKYLFVLQNYALCSASMYAYLKHVYWKVYRIH